MRNDPGRTSKGERSRLRAGIRKPPGLPAILEGGQHDAGNVGTGRTLSPPSRDGGNPRDGVENMRLIDLRERRAAVVDEMRGLVSSDLHDEGRTRFEALKAENERLEQDITRAEYLAEAERRAAADPRDLAGDGTFGRECRSFSLVKAIAAQVPGLKVDAGRELEVSAELQRRSGRAHEGITVPSTVFETRVLTTAAPAGGPGSNIIATDHRADQYIDILARGWSPVGSGQRCSRAWRAMSPSRGGRRTTRLTG
jgi:hypothetical protein